MRTAVGGSSRNRQCWRPDADTLAESRRAGGKTRVPMYAITMQSFRASKRTDNTAELIHAISFAGPGPHGGGRSLSKSRVMVPPEPRFVQASAPRGLGRRP